MDRYKIEKLTKESSIIEYETYLTRLLSSLYNKYQPPAKTNLSPVVSLLNH